MCKCFPTHACVCVCLCQIVSFPFWHGESMQGFQQGTFIKSPMVSLRTRWRNVGWVIKHLRKFSYYLYFVPFLDTKFSGRHWQSGFKENGQNDEEFGNPILGETEHFIWGKWRLRWRGGVCICGRVEWVLPWRQSQFKSWIFFTINCLCHAHALTMWLHCLQQYLHGRVGHAGHWETEPELQRKG